MYMFFVVGLSLSLSCEDMRNQGKDCKESETCPHTVIGETLLQLETAKRTVETLRLERIKAKEAYNFIASELDQSRARVNLLEGLVSKLNVEITNACSNSSKSPAAENGKFKKSIQQLDGELTSVKADLEQLRTTLEQFRSANELAERIKSESSQREAELEAELNRRKAEVEELKTSLMNKETELQAANSEIEAQLRRLKVESEQWRKAAEAAVAMLSEGDNGDFMERIDSEDFGDDDLLKKKNGNVLKKIGVLWKKQQK